MAPSITPIPRMRADWMRSGACTSGSIERRRAATRPASGGAGTTSTGGGEHGRDVHGVDADAWTDLARCRGVVPRHVDGDDGGDDAAIAGADAVALPPGRRWGRGEAPANADWGRRRGLLLRLDAHRISRLSGGCCDGGARDATPGLRAHRSDRGWRGRTDRRRAPVHCVEGPSSRLL